MPTQRRTTLLALTCEQQAFLNPPDAYASSPASSEATLNGQGDTTPPTRNRSQRHAVSPHRSRAVSVPAKHGLALHSVTLRLSPDVVQSLRRASAERTLDYREPYSQQAIVEAALREWLSHNATPLTDH